MGNTEKPFEDITRDIIGWTSIKPKEDNGFLPKGIKLVFDSIDGDILSFKETIDGKISERLIADFSPMDLENLLEENAIEISEEYYQYSKRLTKEEFSNYADSIAKKYEDKSVLPTCDYIIDKRDTIEFPFAVDYKNEWGIWEAIREIVQNAMDTETKIYIDTPNDSTIVIHDEGKGLSIKDFRLGGGEKAKLEESKKYIYDCEPEKLIRGAHGEGMKLTFLVLSKNPNIHKFYHYSRCIRATSEFVISPRFKEKILNIYLDPINPHRGTTFILNSNPIIISNILKQCKERFIYHDLYINGNKSIHTQNEMNEMVSEHSHIEGSKKIVEFKLIGHIIDIDKYDRVENIGKSGEIDNPDKPIYIRGIYVNDMRTVFSYNFICPYLDSARNIVDIKQVKDQIRRIYANLNFRGIDSSIVAEKFVRTLYDGKDFDFIENNINFYSHDIEDSAKEIYRKVWDKVFGKNAFISSNPTLTQLAREQIFVEKDKDGNIIREVHYKEVKLPYFLERLFLASDVQKDSDIVVQETVDIPYSMEIIKRESPTLIKNLRDALLAICPIHDLDPDEEIKKWDVFLVEYKRENQPPKNLWKNWDDIEIDIRENIISSIYSLYREFENYPIIIEKGLNLPISPHSPSFPAIINIHVQGIYKLSKSEIISRYPDLAREIEKYENRIIPVFKKLGYYNHGTERFGIRYDALSERDKTFRVVIHEYAHKFEEVDDIEDYDSAMGKILTVIQNGYGKIMDRTLINANVIYEEYILPTIINKISTIDISESKREEILDSIKTLPENLSDMILAMCTEENRRQKLTTDTIQEEKEEYIESTPKQQEEQERTAHTPWGDYIERGGFTRTEDNLDYMLKNYEWDARNKFIQENLEFDAHHEGLSEDIHVSIIEHLQEPIVTEISKRLFPDSDLNRYYWVAHTNSDYIIAFNLRKDGKYPNIPWNVQIFELKEARFV